MKNTYRNQSSRTIEPNSIQRSISYALAYIKDGLKMWIISLSLLILSILGWVILAYSLRKQYRYATLLVDMLPLYPILALLPAILVSCLGVVWLFPIYAFCLSMVAFVPSVMLAMRFRKWGESYRWNQYHEFLTDVRDTRFKNVLFTDYQEPIDNESRVSVFVRHDVDISLARALRMADMEKNLGIQSTYFFRMHAEKYDFEQAIPVIRKLHSEGFGIGLHYDMLTYTKGDKQKALNLFQKDLSKLREIAPVTCVCAHGDRKYRNRDLWQEIEKDTLQIYSAYDMKYDIYLSDAGGKTLVDSEGKHILKRIDKAQPGQVIQVLIHPDWWY